MDALLGLGPEKPRWRPPQLEGSEPERKLMTAQTTPDRQQAVAELPRFQQANPAVAAQWKDYGFPSYGPADAAQNAGRSLRDMWQSPTVDGMRRGFGQMFNHGAAPGVLAGGGTGALLGLLLGALLKRPGLGATLGGLGGAALGGLAGHWRGQSKQAFTVEPTGAPMPYIRRRVLADTTLSNETQGTLLEAVAQLGMMDLQRLQQILAMAGGAATGALVARFLMSAGLLGTAAGALGGAWLGRRMAGAFQPSTLAGQTLGVQHDLYGNRFNS